MSKIFVFGSNLAGIHGAGAALFAVTHYKAVYGVGIGPQGNSYAIPTKDNNIKTLPLSAIQLHVTDFLEYARCRSDVEFQVTRIGCGLAGYSNKDIAPMFRDAPSNCFLDPDWVQYLKENK